MIIKILTWNMWHGLNPYSKVIMWPIERLSQYRIRRQVQLELLKKWNVASSFNIFCLQEVNPLFSRLKVLRSFLEMEGQGSLVNSGLKLAGWGLPPFLEEGLVTLTGNGFSKSNYSECTLSGSALEKKGPFGIDMHLQLSEVRKCLLLETRVEGLTVAVVNLHLHHGPDAVLVNRSRKAKEIEKLCHWLHPKLDRWDLLFVCGDFNCDETAPYLEPLKSLGLQLPSQTDSRLSFEPTWDPKSNPFVYRSSQLARSPEEREWDGSQHSFDRIYYRSRVPIHQLQIGCLKEPSLSDHFGVSIEVKI